jgi:ubiquinone/menaquinone biosynthesis C-methylase UbiE
VGFYSKVIFPRLCDLALDRPFVAARRRELLAASGGEVLEIGIGTGLNLPNYPQQVHKIAAVDPNPGMHRRAQARAERSGVAVEKYLISSESLPFDAGRFDCVVSTFTMCSIPRVDAALAEIFRVLKSGGQLLFLEHGLSRDVGVQKWQHRLNGLQRLLGDNCHLNRDIRKIVAAQPFANLEVDEFYLEQTPRTHGYTYMGKATK